MTLPKRITCALTPKMKIHFKGAKALIEVYK